MQKNIKNGIPLRPLLPICLISCSDMDDSNDYIIYVGKTFDSIKIIGGHSVVLKLLNPKYNN